MGTLGAPVQPTDLLATLQKSHESMLGCAVLRRSTIHHMVHYKVVFFEALRSADHPRSQDFDQGRYIGMSQIGPRTLDEIPAALTLDILFLRVLGPAYACEFVRKMLRRISTQVSLFQFVRTIPPFARAKGEAVPYVGCYTTAQGHGWQHEEGVGGHEVRK